MSEIDLDAIRERCEKATPGPWEATHRHVGLSAMDDESGGLGLEVEGPPDASLRGQFARGADATFIAASRTDIPALLAHIARLEATIDQQAAAARDQGVCLHMGDTALIGTRGGLGIYGCHTCGEEFTRALGAGEVRE